MKFKTYTKITNSYSEKYIEKIREAALDEYHVKWVVTEKIHGANFAFVCDGNEVKCQKRTSMLEDGENFFDWEHMQDAYEYNILGLYETLKTRDPNLLTVYVYGELCGGNYPHEKIKQDNLSTQIQKGIYYNPSEQFLVFDIFVESECFGSWLNHSDVVDMCERSNLEHVPIVFTGTLDQCLEFPNEFTTLVPKKYGLPRIDDNICEGVVIKPFYQQYLQRDRVLIKNKNEKWKEKSRVPRKHKVQHEITVEQQHWINEILKYLNEARFQTAVSKIGEPDFKLFGHFVKEISNDIILEFTEKRSEELYVDIPNKNDRRIITKELGKALADFVRENIKKYM